MTDLPLWLEAVLAVLVLTGALFTLLGALGLLRFPDFFMRLHAPTQATTLGVGSLLGASLGAAWWRGETGAPELLILLFLFVTAPVSANLMAKAAIHLGLASRAGAAPVSADPAPPPR